MLGQEEPDNEYDVENKAFIRVTYTNEVSGREETCKGMVSDDSPDHFEGGFKFIRASDQGEIALYSGGWLAKLGYKETSFGEDATVEVLVGADE